MSCYKIYRQNSSEYLNCQNVSREREINSLHQYLLLFNDILRNRYISTNVSRLYIQSTILLGYRLLKLSIISKLDVIDYYCNYKGTARTQFPTTKNCTPELFAFGIIARVNSSVVQWKSLIQDQPLSRSWQGLCQVSMILSPTVASI